MYSSESKKCFAEMYKKKKYNEEKNNLIIKNVM